MPRKKVKVLHGHAAIDPKPKREPTPKPEPKWAWRPQPGPQLDAIEARWCPELFFGGARGGGKSEFLLGDYLQDVEEFGRAWQGILIRRTVPELEDLIKRSQGFYPKAGAEWKEGAKEWRWKNGACLRMRHLDDYADAMHYQGHEYQWIGWDELTNWPNDKPYRALFACLRSGPDIRRIRASGNPGGVGHRWVQSRFVNPAPGGRCPIKDEETGLERMFIRSLVTDNKILLKNDPDYVKRLKAVGSEALVRAWLEGDWNIVEGAYFPEFGAEHQVRPFALPRHWLRFGAEDWGYSDPLCFVWGAVSSGTDDEGKPVYSENLKGEKTHIQRGAIVFYREIYQSGLSNEQACAEIKRLEYGDNITYRVASPDMWAERGGPSIAETYMQNGVSIIPADNQRVPGWGQFRSRLRGNEGGPLAFWFTTCAECIRAIPVLQHDDKKPEDAADGDDHAPEACRYAFMSRPLVTEVTENLRDKAEDKGLFDHMQRLKSGAKRRVYQRV